MPKAAVQLGNVGLSSGCRSALDVVQQQRAGTTKTIASISDKDYSLEEPYENEGLTYGSEDQPGG